MIKLKRRAGTDNWYFTVHAQNGELICRSEVYMKYSTAVQSIDILKHIMKQDDIEVDEID